MAAEQGRQADLAEVAAPGTQADLEPAGKAIQAHLAAQQPLVMKLAAAAAQAQQGLKDLRLHILKVDGAAPAKLPALVARLLFTAQAAAAVRMAALRGI